MEGFNGRATEEVSELAKTSTADRIACERYPQEASKDNKNANEVQRSRVSTCLLIEEHSLMTSAGTTGFYQDSCRLLAEVDEVDIGFIENTVWICQQIT